MNANPYHLYVSQRSPFARRIRLCLRRLGLKVNESFVDAFQEPADLNAANPLGLLPTLITPNQESISDSSNILEYLEDQTGEVWPSDLSERLAVRQSAVLATGVMQSSILYFQETKMHDVPSEFWISEHLKVIEETLAHLARSPKENLIVGKVLTQAGWDLVTALEYLTLRIPEIKWATKFPLFVELHEIALNDSFFAETTPKM
jgi:glutathione S-transferase